MMNHLRLLFFSVFLILVSCAKEESKEMEGLLSINGTELYVKVIGRGEPIIFLHGGPGLGFDYFLPQMENLKKDYKLIFFDQRISGRSSADVSPDSINLDLFISDIEAIRNYFEQDKVNILAHSWGNLLAVEYALNFPESIDKLILSNPVPFSKEFDEALGELQIEKMSPSFLEARQNMLLSEEFKNRELSAYENLFKLSFSLSFFDKINMKELNFNLFDGFFERNEKMQYFTGLEDFNYYKELGAIKTPTLVIRGLYDLAVLEADQKIVDSLANARLVEMNFSGHFPFVEQPEEYLWEIRNFLTTD